MFQSVRNRTFMKSERNHFVICLLIYLLIYLLIIDLLFIFKDSRASDHHEIGKVLLTSYMYKLYLRKVLMSPSLVCLQTKFFLRNCFLYDIIKYFQIYKLILGPLVKLILVLKTTHIDITILCCYFWNCILMN